MIDPEAAPKLGLEAFGELHVTGMAGKVRSNFRCALFKPVLPGRDTVRGPCRGAT